MSKAEKDYMQSAFDEAFSGMRNNEGGPFGAVVVLDGKIIGRGHNQVLTSKDPTAHAEILAIREACASTQNYHLEKATLYTTCEPCPMCLAAIQWAKISCVEYVMNRNDAESIGFSDRAIYQKMGIMDGVYAPELLLVPHDKASLLWQEWKDKDDKTLY